MPQTTFTLVGTGAALLIRTSLALGTVDPGYTTENVLVMRTSLSRRHR